ncbi:MAG: lasso peptide biosynthesis B2 protein [Pseudomonadota bacterium]
MAQSPYVPANGELPHWRDLPWLTMFAMRACLELIRARLVFAKLEAKAILERNQQARAKAWTYNQPNEQSLARIAYVIPRLSTRLPWRSDCMIQAIAAQNWLSSLRAYGEIQIGVENPKDGEFGAHAWLICDETIVTGGDIARYNPILAESQGTGD